ncbi:hypothetical protein PDJAM_G00111510 [Pangasius djambal]|uniref:Uncharacterized protein n=1 Tax=Pangasius djambal TaxID=1691987 RepID=A0ACC5Y2K7_9TELE|nr:hypothetical protein [Pangasius djambal]
MGRTCKLCTHRAEAGLGPAAPEVRGTEGSFERNFQGNFPEVSFCPPHSLPPFRANRATLLLLSRSHSVSVHFHRNTVLCVCVVFFLESTAYTAASLRSFSSLEERVGMSV